MIAVTVRHPFQTGHRLPQLEGKCQSLHGHSWWAEITVGQKFADPSGIVIDFGVLKKYLRDWIDNYLDHGLMLGADDPLVSVLRPMGKVFVFTEALGSWPTVENVAALLADVATDILISVDPGAEVKLLQVRVTETHLNEATWTP